MLNGIDGDCLDESGMDGENVSETKYHKHECNCWIIEDCSVLWYLRGGHPESRDRE